MVMETIYNEMNFFMFMGYIFTATLLIFIFVLLPLWYIGKTNAEKRRNKHAEGYLNRF